MKFDHPTDIDILKHLQGEIGLNPWYEKQLEGLDINDWPDIVHFGIGEAKRRKGVVNEK